MIRFKSAAKDEVYSRELVTKNDLLIALKEQELRLIKWILGTGISGIVIIAGMLKFMH